MSKLKIVDAYEKEDGVKIESFKDNIRSTLQVNSLFDKVETDYEWLDIMEDTIRYLDNILRNPNRFIINEEEIVKVELARRITVDSIKHLSKHTNFIQEINENDEVRPSKILNINKEESFDTYENRLIYTLVQRMRDFIEIRKRNLAIPYVKDTKKLEYEAKSIIGQEKVNMTLVIDSKIDTTSQSSGKGMDLEDRVAKLEADISMLTGSEVYRNLQKKRVAYVIPPIKKTNVILKNVNFQYAMRLWNYLQNNIDNNENRVKENKNYEDTGVLKDYVNDTFILNYVALQTLNIEDPAPIRDEDVEALTNNLIERIVELNADLPENKLKKLIGEKVIIAKTKKTASLVEIQEAFAKQIKIYLQRIEKFRFEE